MKKKSLSELIEDRLYDIIASGDKYHLGDRLPSENNLSVELGVSRTTLREAMRSLVTQGILETRRGSGTYVVGNHERAAAESANSLRRLKGRLQDLYEVRLMIEPQAAYLAAQRASEQEIKKIIALGEQEEPVLRTAMENEIDPQSIKEWSAIDRAFHEAIIQAAKNSYLINMLPMITRSINESILLADDRSTKSVNTITDHGYIMRYLRERDAEGVRYAMMLHIYNTIRG